MQHAESCIINKACITSYQLLVLLLGYVFWQPLNGSGGGRNCGALNLEKNRDSKLSPVEEAELLYPEELCPALYILSRRVGGVGGSPLNWEKKIKILFNIKKLVSKKIWTGNSGMTGMSRQTHYPRLKSQSHIKTWKVSQIR